MSRISDQPPILLIISGPAGSGKTTLCDRLLANYPEDLERIVTTTSRDPRPGEKNGLDYHFLPPDGFEEAIRCVTEEARVEAIQPEHLIMPAGICQGGIVVKP